MKRYIKSSIILLAALALTGCSKTEEFEHNPDNALQIESVSGISPFALMQEPASKAVITGETLPGDEATKGIGLFVTATDGTAYDGRTSGYSNVKYTFNNAKWSAASPIYLSNTTGKLYGYFPCSTAATDLKAIPVESSLNSTDYLYATSQDVSFSNKSVNLQMNHALARLHLTIKKGDKYLSDCCLTKIVLQSKAIDANGTMDITTGAVTATKAADATGTFILTGTDAVTKTGIEKDILLVPADNSEGKKDITLTLTIDGVEAKVIFTGDKGLDIRSGIQCNATIEIQDTGIKVTGVGVGVWGDGGSQTVQVSGHTVTVKLSDDEGISDDLIVQVASNGSSVIVKTYSDSGKPLVIRNDDATLVAPVEDGNKSTFTISDITSDITATLAYAKIFKVTGSIVPDVTPAGGYLDIIKFEGLGDYIEGRYTSVTVKINGTAPGYKYTKMVCDGRTVTGDTIVLEDDSKDLEVSALYEFYDYPLPRVFTVADDGEGNVRKVKFARGNMWCQNNVLHNEDEQYQFSRDDWASNGHISHFMYSKSLTESVKQTFVESGVLSGDIFFTNAARNQLSPNPDLIVNGQKGIWRVLSGGEGGEWDYLLNSRTTTYGNGTGVENRRYAAVKVNDIGGLLIFPDEFSWPTAAGTEPATFNAVESDWNGVNYKSAAFEALQSAGCVFLPAAGYRNGNPDTTSPASVDLVGDHGYYWSASPIYDDYYDDYDNYYDYRYYYRAYALHFYRLRISPSSNASLFSAQSVRLVTEAN